ncbi:putative ras suppressor protein 1, rsu1 [Schistosoma mansoni]|uniref:putative ras suppressor protein 1, rsu1 n=1 Tax=Schistosoma mansoni TaxID=6183 RepID=UPI00022DC1D3|nr:putative ras suppressor protein 1, rsu1 [Schistosoma mansoni]|eukprot:XP_018647844.1 putative ras suppressor protein 1, rsu1 [Schistosoma mansoni]
MLHIDRKQIFKSESQEMLDIVPGGIWARGVKDDLITSVFDEQHSFCDFSSSLDAPNITLTSELLVRSLFTICLLYQLKRGLIKDPQCICEVDVSCLGLEDLEPDLHLKFTSLRKLVAADNALSLECCKNFNGLVELDLSLNQINSLSRYSPGFDSLQYLNLSYNFLQSADIEKLGYLPSLRILYLSGNDLRKLPPDLSETGLTSDEHIVFKFSKLEILHLDDNKLSDAQDFASLGTLPRLTYLNLANNRFTTVPLLKSTPLKKHQINEAQNNSAIENIPFLKSTTLNETTQHDSLLISHNEQSEDNEHEEGKSASSTDQQIHFLQNYSLSLDEHRNPNAPRVRIVDEFLGLYNLKKLFPLIYDKQTKYNHQRGCKSIQSDPDIHVHKSNSRLLLTAKEKSTLDQTFTTDELVLLDNEQKSDIQSKTVPPPFQFLQSIDLSHNKISCEEHLLPIAVWPKLRECIIYANPVISKSSRIPQLLERLLIKQLHINLYRNPIDNPNLFKIKNTNLLERNELNSCVQHLSLKQNQDFGNNEITAVNSGTSTKNSLSHKNISKYKKVLNKDKEGISYNSSMKPFVIRYKLDKPSLDLGPKMIKCNVNQILDEMKKLNQTNIVNSSPLSPPPTTTVTSIASVTLSNLSNSPTLNDSFKDNSSMYNESRKISHSLQLPTIERYKTFIKNDSQKLDQNLSEFLSNLQCDEQIEEENEDMNNFFTTQLSSINTTDPTKHHTSKLNHSNHSDYIPFHQQNSTENDNNQSNEQYEDKTPTKCSTNSGSLLSNLEWIIDEKNLPNSMQACLRELRYLLQHKPTIHPYIHQNIILSPLTLPGDNHQPIEYPIASTSSSSKLIEDVVNSKVQVSSEKSCNQALKDEEIQKRQLEKIKAKQNPLVRNLKLVKNSNQPKRTKSKGPKELFEQDYCCLMRMIGINRRFRPK